MKYTESNKPLVCMMTQSTCYKGTTTMTPKGVLWHSTGANNPTLKRYVQPDDNAPNRDELIALIGKNSYGNDWNHTSVQAGLNCWIGKLADGTVTTVQTMPWNYKPWGCGSGSKGSCNNGWMQFEICEDGLTDKAYFDAVYKEACEITAYYCKMYNLDPKGTVQYNGVTVPVILDHKTSCSLKLGGNHGDVQHWFSRYGKTLDDVRNDVAALMGNVSAPSENNKIDGEYTKGVAVQLSTNFKSTEFDCHGNGCCTKTQVDQKLVEYLQNIRTHFGKAVNVSSGYRCATHNKNVGGATGSYHAKGQAADIYINGVAPAEIAKYAESIGILGIGLYETNADGYFVHVDTRTTKSFWYGQAQTYRSTFGGAVEQKPDASKVDTSAADPKKMWDYFLSKGMNEYGVAGVMGNLYAESGLRAANLQNTYEKSLGMTDAEYTAAVDAGTYTNFVKDSAGYGLAQWTYWSLKQDMYNYIKKLGKSIGDLNAQMEFLAWQLSTQYTAVWKVLTTATSVREASDAMLLKFERPADQSEAVQKKRAEYGQKYYDQFATKTSTPAPTQPTQNTQSYPTLRNGSKGESVKTLQTKLTNLGYNLGSVDGAFGPKTETAVRAFQKDNDLDRDGICGPKTWAALNSAKYVKGEVTASALNVRSGAGLNYKVNKVIKKGTRVIIVSEKNGWARLINNVGYVSLDYIKKI